MIKWKQWMLIALFMHAGISTSNAQDQSGIRAENMNPNVNPGTDFYQYACGGWMKNHPLTAEYSSFGTFDVLIENNNKRLQELIKELQSQEAPQGSLNQKIAQLYASAMDSVARNQAGWSPIKPYLKEIQECSNPSELIQLTARLQRMGIPGFFYFYVGADIKNSKQNLLELFQGGTGMGEKEYYFGEDEATVKIREAYKKYIVDMLSYCGFEKDAQQMMEDIMRIETRLARYAYNATERRNPEANYHKMSYEDLKKDFPGIDWDTYFSIVGFQGIQEISVAQPEPIREAIRVVNEESMKSLRTLLCWQFINSSASSLDDNMRKHYFAFYGTAMTGKQQDRPRWKQALGVVESYLGEALGRIYVEHYFPQAAKDRMITLVKNLQIALGERIEKQEWMSEATKKAALEKLSTFRVKVGYPDKWQDFSKLEIGNSLFQNMVNCSEFETEQMIAKRFNKPVDPDEWLMNPQTVNAYYNPTTNEICFPAGILQYPFFDMNNDDAFNYGGIGVVIGHEMTHGFDDQGRQFDKDGNLADWWTEEDAKRFDARAKVMKDYSDQIEVLPGLHANGKLTLGENLADHGGIKVSLQAFHNATKDAPLPVKDGFTPEQRFFLAYATLWASNTRDEAIRQQTRVDPHPLDRLRVNGALPHIDAWYKAFGITEKDPMFLPKKDRLNIW